MTTFQAIVYAIIRGFTQFLPLSWDGHRILVPWLIHWTEPSGVFLGALALGTFLAAFLYIWNDWASLISSFLQIILLRRKPMTLDERMPFFILIAVLPMLLTGSRLADQIHIFSDSPVLIAVFMGAFIIPLWLTDSMCRKNKSVFDWNWLDALLVGIALLLVPIIPGIGAMGAIWATASFRNYTREATTKFALYLMSPILLTQAVQELHELDFHSSSPASDLSWLSLGVALVVSFLAGILTINALMNHVRKKGVGQYIAYRLVFALGTVAVYWYRARSL
ncbi:MAG: undecaprenyl-diphosphate phosphatase [Oligoflexia bacterium]|nr:undecaprenyl-diphosphate phosphatase [Oligoflexia bacterium]